MILVHIDQWSTDFITEVLEMIEDPPSCDTDDQVPDALVNVVLSFNQHFTGQWMVSPPAGVVVFTRSNYKHKTPLLPVYSEFSLIRHHFISAKPFNLPQFPSTNIMYKY